MLQHAEIQELFTDQALLSGNCMGRQKSNKQHKLGICTWLLKTFKA